MNTIRFAPLFLLAGSLTAQNGAAFDTASIKPSPPNHAGSMIAPMPGGNLRIEGVAVKNMIAWAYELREFQISGGPGWMDSTAWDIVAKSGAQGNAEPAAEPAKRTEAEFMSNAALVRQRLQALLAERFQLTVHRESKEMQAYVLTVAKGGMKLEESKPTDTGFRGLRMGRGQIVGGDVRIELLASYLASALGRSVADETGLKGHYNFKIEWTPDRPANADSADSNGPSIFTALTEQTGLRLESQKRPVEMLVIDRLEKPSEN